MLEGSVQIPQLGPVESHLETAVGYQFSLRPVFGSTTAWRRNIVLGTEMQWFHDGDPDHLRFEIAPGIALPTSAERSYLIGVTLSGTTAGPDRGDVDPGISLGYQW